MESQHFSPPFKCPSLAKYLVLTTLILTGCGGNDQTTESPSSTDPIKLTRANDSKAVENFIKEGLKDYVRHTEGSLFFQEDQTLTGDSPAETEAGTERTFSGTNLQVNGVDEADLVKYDGNYLYIASNQPLYTIYEAAAAEEISARSGEDRFAPVPEPEYNAKVRILKTQTGDKPTTEPVTELNLNTSEQIRGLYLDSTNGGAHLSVLSTDTPSYNFSWLRYMPQGTSRTHLHLYDVSQPEVPNPVARLTLDGELVDSRRIDDHLYIVTRFSVPLPEGISPLTEEEMVSQAEALIDETPIDDLLPKLRINDSSAEPLVTASDCYIPATPSAQWYAPTLVTVTVVNLANPTSPASTCVSGLVSGVYGSTKSLYLFNDQWYQDTVVHKFSLESGGAPYRASGVIPGSLGWRAPAFRLTEKDDVLVAVSTVFPQDVQPVEPLLLEDVPLTTDEAAPTGPSHRLSVLRDDGDGNLKITAQIPNEAAPSPIGKPNEDIYAVRFDGDRGYIVTYRKTDPLYVINLADVDHPVIEGELHVEGYSDYLHPFGNYLLGIGKSAIVADGTAWYQGVQVGLFDVSDMSNPQLLGQQSLGKRGTETDVSYTHKAFSVLPVSDTEYRLAMPVRLHDGPQKHPSDWTNWNSTGLYLFDLNLLDGPTLTLQGVVTAERASGETPYENWVEVQRGVLNEDSVFYVYGDQVFSSHWNAPEQL